MAAVDYGSGLSIPQNTRTLIDSYRADWRALCEPAGTRKPALSDLLASAKQIEADFKRVFEAFDDAILNDRNFDVRRFDVVNELVSRKFPEFIPAFQGAFGEHETFSPSLAAFRQSAALGTSEDRLFLESGIPLEGDFPPFITRTWEYGGCVRHGEYDWTGVMKGIARVKQQARSAVYLKETDQFEEKLFSQLSPNGAICTCKATEAVLKDYVSIQQYIGTEARFAAHAAAIRQTVAAIESGRITVQSDREKHCSGG